MKADIERVTFAPAKLFQRVLLQQGRVQLPADWNEQVDILLAGMRTLAADLIGPWGGSPGAFRIDTVGAGREDFTIGTGHYYVDGILCDNLPGDGGETARYLRQPYYPVPDRDKLDAPHGTNQYLVYLDVWERLVTAAEDEDIREVALGGPDTAARTQVVWQVKARQFAEDDLAGLDCQSIRTRWPDLLDDLRPAYRGQLRARARIPEDELNRPCAIDPRAGYRHDENALFRVEVHTPGPAEVATFSWSLDNGSVAFPVESFSGNVVHLANLGRDARSTLEPGDWVELEYDTYVLQGRAEPLFQVVSVDYLDLVVELNRAPAPVPANEYPRLRRWDQKGTKREPLQADGTVQIVEAATPDGGWINLRYGVQVQFVQTVAGSPPLPANHYQTGDYWLIPARTALGDVRWPQTQDVTGIQRPAALPPNGVEHHYAPLAWIAVAADGTVTVRQRFVRQIQELAACPEHPDGGM